LLFVSQLIAAKAFRSKRCFLISEFGLKRPLIVVGANLQLSTTSTWLVEMPVSINLSTVLS